MKNCTKKCSTCKETKPVVEFNKDKTRKDGLYPQCKSCREAYYQANQDKIVEQKRTYYQANREQKKATVKAYRQANKHKINAISAKRRARKKSAIVPLTAEEKWQVQLFYEAAKFYTMIHDELYEVDHILPLSKGGLHHPNNLRVIPASENRSKNARVMTEAELEAMYDKAQLEYEARLYLENNNKGVYEE